MSLSLPLQTKISRIKSFQILENGWANSDGMEPDMGLQIFCWVTSEEQWLNKNYGMNDCYCKIS